MVKKNSINEEFAKAQQRAGAGPRKGPGRPPGAKNKPKPPQPAPVAPGAAAPPGVAAAYEQSVAAPPPPPPAAAGAAAAPKPEEKKKFTPHMPKVLVRFLGMAPIKSERFLIEKYWFDEGEKMPPIAADTEEAIFEATDNYIRSLELSMSPAAQLGLVMLAAMAGTALGAGIQKGNHEIRKRRQVKAAADQAQQHNGPNAQARTPKEDGGTPTEDGAGTVINAEFRKNDKPG